MPPTDTAYGDPPVVDEYVPNPQLDKIILILTAIMGFTGYTATLYTLRGRR